MAGGLKRELKTKYGIEPKMKMQYGELEVLVNGRRAFFFNKSGNEPSVQEVLSAIEAAAAGKALASS